VSELTMSVIDMNCDEPCSDDVEREHPPSFPVPVRVWAPAVLLGLALFAVAAGAALGDWENPPAGAGGSGGWLSPVAFVISAFSLICSVAVPLGILRESGLRADDEWKCERDCNQLDMALGRIGDKTLSGLARANFKQMRTFTVIAQRQARMSFYASLTASGIALFILIAGAAAANGLTATPAKITAGSLAAAGAALSGFLAKTFLNSYSMAARQMSYYYGQPLVHCYLLHAEWLMSVAEKSSGDQATFRLWQQIIEASLKAGTVAQDHLLSMQAGAAVAPVTTARTGRLATAPVSAYARI
jgi:hypothetical protein